MFSLFCQCIQILFDIKMRSKSNPKCLWTNCGIFTERSRNNNDHFTLTLTGDTSKLYFTCSITPTVFTSLMLYVHEPLK